jgi:type IV secretory pathway VirB6-like protein
MSIRSLVVVVIGIIAFVIIDQLITTQITGTDGGSQLIQTLLRIIVAAAIIIGVVKGIGGKG